MNTHAYQEYDRQRSLWRAQINAEEARKVPSWGPTGHESGVEYTNSDDGIWLGCSCGWQLGLGFSPSAEKIVFRWREHLDGLTA